MLCEQMTFGHLAGALHEVLVALGGTARVWRTDRMATTVIPGTDRLNPQFAQLAKHYGAEVAVCPRHRPQRKGVVEAAIRLLGGRWWRTARAGSMAAAQRHLDAWLVRVSDARRRRGSTVGQLGASEPLRPLPALAFPAEITPERVASRSALVAFEANRYSVGPAHAGKRLVVRARVGEPHLRIFTAAGALVATHRCPPSSSSCCARGGDAGSGAPRARWASGARCGPGTRAEGRSGRRRRRGGRRAPEREATKPGAARVGDREQTGETPRTRDVPDWAPEDGHSLDTSGERAAVAPVGSASPETLPEAYTELLEFEQPTGLIWDETPPDPPGQAPEPRPDQLVILSALFELRFLLTSQIHRQMPDKSLRTAQRRLDQMFRAGWVRCSRSCRLRPARPARRRQPVRLETAASPWPAAGAAAAPRSSSGP